MRMCADAPRSRQRSDSISSAHREFVHSRYGRREGATAAAQLTVHTLSCNDRFVQVMIPP